MDDELRHAFLALHGAVTDQVRLTAATREAPVVPRRSGSTPGSRSRSWSVPRATWAPLAVAASVVGLVGGAWLVVTGPGTQERTGDHAVVGTSSTAVAGSPSSQPTTEVWCGTAAPLGPWQDASPLHNDLWAVGAPRAVRTGPLGGPAVTLDGAHDGLRTDRLIPDTGSTTLAVWLRTTHSGGIVAQYASDPVSTTPAMYDRQLYLTASGQLVFGVYTTTPVTVTSPLAYTDGRWHLAVGSIGRHGLRLLVDGELVASSTQATAGQNFSGYWRFGDGRGGWPSTTARTTFAGSLAQPATWSSELSDGAITALTRASDPAGYAAAVLSAAPEALGGYWPLGGAVPAPCPTPS